MGSPEVRLFADDQLIRAVPFEGERMRVGRRPENDLVVEDLAVSRMHAVLIREPDGSIVLEDAGSGNGSYLDGQRIEGRAVIPPGRPVRMGRHVVVWVDLEGSPSRPPVSHADEQTLDAPSGLLGGPEEGASTATAEPAPASGEVSMFDFALEEDLAPDSGLAEDDGVSLEDDELPGLGAGQALDLAEDDDLDLARDADLDPASATPQEEEPAPFELGEDAVEPSSAELAEEAPEPLSMELAEDAVEPLSVELAEDAVEPPSAELAEDVESPRPADLVGGAAASTGDGAADPLVAPEQPALHAGLVVQEGGVLRSVVAWEAERMCIGRGDDCEVLLDATGVSRRHALLVREGGSYEVRDLESINGTQVNGERVRRRVLDAGDVIRIEDFELTFLLDHCPIADEVQVERAESRAARGAPETPLDLTLIREFDVGGGGEIPTFDGDAPPTLEVEMPGESPTGDPSLEAPTETGADPFSVAPEADLFGSEDAADDAAVALDLDASDALFVDGPDDADRDDATELAPELMLFDGASEAGADAAAGQSPPDPPAEVASEASLPSASVLEAEEGDPGFLEADDDKEDAPRIFSLDASLAEGLGPEPLQTSDDEAVALVSVDAADPMEHGVAGAQGEATHAGLVFELQLRDGELPPALAEAVRNSEDGELRIPVELRIRRS